MREKREGSPANWTRAHISCPLDWASWAIRETDMHTEGGGLGEAVEEQDAGGRVASRERSGSDGEQGGNLAETARSLHFRGGAEGRFRGLEAAFEVPVHTDRRGRKNNNNI